MVYTPVTVFVLKCFLPPSLLSLSLSLSVSHCCLLLVFTVSHYCLCTCCSCPSYVPVPFFSKTLIIIDSVSPSAFHTSFIPLLSYSFIRPFTSIPLPSLPTSSSPFILSHPRSLLPSFRFPVNLLTFLLRHLYVRKPLSRQDIEVGCTQKPESRKEPPCH